MIVPFVKYQGTGNDFIIIDQRQQKYLKKGDTEIIRFLCDRRFGIGADGLMLLENDDHSSFRMVYFNADGNESTMCGNGGRCIAHFAYKKGVFSGKTTFEAIDGLHEVEIQDNEVHLKMIDVPMINEATDDDYILFTGSPHYVRLTSKIPENIVLEGRSVRYSETFKKEGINVNFTVFDKNENKAIVATYERGVEDETLSCGTGVTAAALACAKKYNAPSPVRVETKGGQLSVSFRENEDGFTDVWLSGPATFVFEGTIIL
jgi:diaminopimelate epimerase